jgi:NADH dehydrogenase
VREKPELAIVTGAFGYTGRHITQQLLSVGKKVRTLTGHPHRPHPFGDQVEAVPFSFDRPDELVKNLRGATTLYNTYWVRFSRGKVTHDLAVENTRTLIRAAEQAGLRRIVHISITNPSADSPFPYFRGKAQLEQAIQDSTLSYAILRPTVIFGDEGVLLNNIAWLLHRFPVFAVPGSGEYRIQPVFVGDVAKMAVDLAHRDEDVVIDAVGPETFTFTELVKLIAQTIDRRPLFFHLPAGLALSLSRVLGFLVGDVMLTRNELDALMANLLISHDQPTAPTRLSDWLEQNSAEIGITYMQDVIKFSWK